MTTIKKECTGSYDTKKRRVIFIFAKFKNEQLVFIKCRFKVVSQTWNDLDLNKIFTICKYHIPLFKCIAKNKITPQMVGEPSNLVKVWKSRSQAQNDLDLNKMVTYYKYYVVLFNCYVWKLKVQYWNVNDYFHIKCVKNLI